MKKDIENLIDKLADKTLSFGQKMKPKGKFKSQNGVIGFNTNDVFTLVHVDSKYEWTFTHPQVRGVIQISRNTAKEMIVIGHQIMIGDVLEKTEQQKTPPECHAWTVDLCDLWRPCGFKKSFQQIIEESGWEDVDFIMDVKENEYGQTKQISSIEQLKSPEARALLEFILNLKLV